MSPVHFNLHLHYGGQEKAFKQTTVFNIADADMRSDSPLLHAGPHDCKENL